MDSDLIIPSETNKTEVLNQIDALHEEHRLKILRELATKYNDDLIGMSYYAKHIKLEKHGNNAFDLIFSLWARGIKVPQGLALGEPYDDVFSEASPPRGYRYSVKYLRPVILIRNPSMVRFFLLSATNFADNRYDINSYIGKLRKEDGSSWPEIKTRDQFREFLRNESLTAMDLAFLALSLNSKDMFYANFSIQDIEYYVLGHIGRR